MSYYVVLDREDPGSEHDTWEEAARVLDEQRKKLGPLPDARIILPDPVTEGWSD